MWDEEEGKVGQHYIDKLGRVVVAVADTRACEGCIYDTHMHCAQIRSFKKV